jgi:hypothetical protein
MDKSILDKSILDKSLYGMHIVVVGNPVAGCSFYGPFDTGQEATEWAILNYDVIGNDWCIAPLASQEGE